MVSEGGPTSPRLLANAQLPLYPATRFTNDSHELPL